MNKQPATKHQLACALFATGKDIRASIAGIDFASVCSVERESGSGHTFNVSGYNLQGEKQTIFVQTVD